MNLYGKVKNYKKKIQTEKRKNGKTSYELVKNLKLKLNRLDDDRTKIFKYISYIWYGGKVREIWGGNHYIKRIYKSDTCEY